MAVKNKFKLFTLVGIAFSVVSLLGHLLLANYSTGEIIQHGSTVDGIYQIGQKFRHRKLWGSVQSLEALQPCSNPRNAYPVPRDHNGFLYAKIYGGFDHVRSSICDLVAVSRLLNATLIIPEIQESLQSKGISSKFRSFSYVYNEEQFIAALSNDVVIVKSLPDDLKRERKINKYPTFSVRYSAPPSFYIKEVLPKLKHSKVVGLLIADGGCLEIPETGLPVDEEHDIAIHFFSPSVPSQYMLYWQMESPFGRKFGESILPKDMEEYQRLRCRVAFHALQFRPEIQALGNLMVARLRASGRPYLAFHPGLTRDVLAFHGCAELFQDIHSELLQYRRKQMIKHGIIHGNLSMDSMAQKRKGLCPLMPEEVSLLLRAMGYPSDTMIYLSGAETFGGQRTLVPLRAIYANSVDRTSLCSEKELSILLGSESPIPPSLTNPPPLISKEKLIREWNGAGPRPRPRPPPPARPFYQYEKEGWYGWIAEKVIEPNHSLMDMRMRAHGMVWNALDYHVSVEADAFFPGFHNDGSGWPDFSSLVMGHRSYQMSASRTFRPDRKTIVKLLDTIKTNQYHPKQNWTVLARQHLNDSLGIDGFISAAENSKPNSFISHPLPECSCRASSSSKSSEIPNYVIGSDGRILFGDEEICPEWLSRSLEMVVPDSGDMKDEIDELPQEEPYLEQQQQEQQEQDSSDGREMSSPGEQDEEMDPED